MGVFKKKNVSNNNKLSRKQQRKNQRKAKKERKQEYYVSRSKPGKYVLNHSKVDLKEPTPKNKKDKQDVTPPQNNVLSTEQLRLKEQKQQKKIKQQMMKQRNKQLLEANIEEDRTIKRLEKQLKLNKRKSKGVSKSFAIDGLDYLLEVCDSEAMKQAVEAEKQLNEVNDEFEEDFSLMTGNEKEKKKQKNFVKEQEMDDLEDLLNQDDSSDTDEEDILDADEYDEEINEDNEYSKGESNDETDSDELVLEDKKRIKTNGPKKKVKLESNNEDSGNNSEESSKPDGTWEDIYGRLRGKDGTVLNAPQEKYIPPAVRARMEANMPTDKKHIEKLNRLRRQLKGLLNRLAESNMHNISNEIEKLYMNNSRNDMNETITNLVMESIISNVIAPERLLMEHVMLMTILHANIGTEVGAHFLQTVVKKFEEISEMQLPVENKSLDNIVNILAQLYNFKLFDSKLMYELLKKLSENFEEKDVECILHILRSVGFTLRKDDPLALKNLIFELQKQASNVSEADRDNSRVKFMLDILLAIKNNNMTKIPNYDTSYSEHLKKIMKGFIRKGNYVTQLNISWNDLLKADERGKWWVVGSAWTGTVGEQNESEKKDTSSNIYSEKLLELAKAQRMNTDTRRSIFCIIMSAEDYLDAFEKLLKLGLKNQQEREIIHVILHCCLQEKKYNPYYGVLSQKFCEYDRKFQMTIKCSVWDKLKTLNEHSGSQLSNLSKLLTHLFIEKGLPISTLKIVQFSELDKVTLRFMRQILLGILLHHDVEACQEVFVNVAQSDKLKMFKESLRLFIHHFLLKNLNSNSIPQEQKDILQARVKIVDKLLAMKNKRQYN